MSDTVIRDDQAAMRSFVDYPFDNAVHSVHRWLWLATLAFPAALRAQVQADVIIALDCSGSMWDEIAMVQSDINGFASRFTSAGADLHVVLISKTGSICVPGPLGSGTCPADQNLPGYRHTLVNIASGNVFSSILSSYTSWSASMRSGASTTVIAITDDNDTMSATTFNAQFLALNPKFQDYRFHALVAHSACPYAGAIGTQYLNLVSVTGGESHDLCDQDFVPDLDSMATAALALPSSYCTSGLTSHGCTPLISGTGAASASAGSGFSIAVSGVEGQKSGLFFYGLDNSSWTPTPWGGTSYLCVKAPTQRTPTLTSGGTASQCNGVLALDWNAFIASSPGALGAPFAGGETVYAQAWFRDPPAPKTTNLSNALAFIVQP